MVWSNASGQESNGTFFNSTDHLSDNGSLYLLKLTSQKQIELFAWIIITPCLSFIGAFNNILVLLVTWPKQGGTSGLNLLIFHFIAANLFMCLVNIPISVFMVQVKRAGFVVANDACNIIHAIYTFGLLLINWSDAGLAINRCIALFFPYSYKTWTTRSVNCGMVTFAWIVSLGAVLPLSFGVGGVMGLNPLGMCVYLPSPDSLGTFFTALVYVSYSIAGVGAVLIWWKSYCLSRNKIVGNNCKSVLRRLRIAKMLLFTFLWSAFCSLPYGVISVNFKFLFVQDPVSVLWLRVCLAGQYGFTPCILLLSNVEYRQRLKQMMRPVVAPTNSLPIITVKKYVLDTDTNPQTLRSASSRYSLH